MKNSSKNHQSIAYIALIFFSLIFLAVFLSHAIKERPSSLMSGAAIASSSEESGEPASSSSGGWEMDMPDAEDHSGHDHAGEDEGHEDHEGHAHVGGEESHEGHAHDDHEGHDDHEEHAPGVVHLDPNSIRNFGIETETINPGGLTHTLDLYGWIRPRPENVYTVRAPFKAILTEVHQLPGDQVEEGQPLVTLVIPDMLDWKTTILSSQNEIERIKETRELLRAEGQARIVELIGNYLQDRANVRKLEIETKILEQAGASSVSVREIGVKKGELNVARSSMYSRESVLKTYGVDPEKLKNGLDFADIDEIAGQALPPDIRTQLRKLEFELKASQLASSSAASKLRMLDIE
ncbi:MAG: hypothetical protein KC931_04165, partial [Candidatus Omnitrophica bacterium]|nr:hypothetical protein [Candidatus Omnitrophota bacterium]